MPGEDRGVGPDARPVPRVGDSEVVRSLLTRHLQSMLADPAWLWLRQRFVFPRLAPVAQAASASSHFDLVKAAEELVSTLVGKPSPAARQQASFAELLCGTTQLLLLGDVGAGKTALLQATAVDYAGYSLDGNEDVRAEFALCEEYRFPVYVDLRDVGAETIEEYLGRRFRGLLRDDEPQFSVNRLLVTQPFLFLFDHVDRVPAPRQLEVVASLAEFIHERHPQHRYVIACRRHDFPLFQAWFKGAQILTLMPLLDDDLSEMTSLRLGESRAQALLQRLSVEEGLWELARNPRLLQALCSLSVDADLSRLHLAQILEGLVRMLLAEAEIPGEQAERQSPLCYLYPALSTAAFQMQREGRDSLERTVFYQLLDSVLSSWPKAPSARELAAQLVGTGLLECDSERTWLGFRSPILRAFFATCHVAAELEKGKSLGDLLPLEEGDDWQICLTLLPGLVAADRVLRDLVRKGEDEASIRLAVRCALQFEQPYATLARLAPLSPGLHIAYGRAFRKLGYPGQARLALESALKLKPQQAAVHLELAEVLREQGDYEAAAAQYALGRALGSDPVSSQAGIGLSYLARGMAAEAKEELDRAERALAESQACVHHLRGHVLESAAEFDQALSEYRAAVSLTPSVHHLCHQAALQRRLGDLEAAQASLLKALDADPLAAEAWLELGLLHEAKGMLEKAAEAYSQAIRCQPSSALARVYRGRLCGKLNQPVRAMAELSYALQLDPNCGAGYAELGALAQSRGRYTEALGYYRRAIQCEPRQASYHQQIGWLLKLMGRPEEAETELELALRLDPRNAEHRSRLGSALADQGKYREALAAFAEAASLRPDEPLYRHNMGAMYARLGQPLEAEKSLLEALRLCLSAGGTQSEAELPLESAMLAAESYSELGFLRYGQERYEEALRHFQRAAQLVPFADAYLSRQAMVYRRLGQFEAAVRALRQAADLSPDDASLQMELGIALQEMGKLDEASAVLQRAVELSPGEASYHHYLGATELARGRAEEAIPSLETALRLQPDLIAARHDLAKARLRCGQVEQALTDVRQAIEVDPDTAAYHATLGECFLALGKLEQAAEELDKAVSLDPQMAEGHYQTARLRVAEGRYEEALTEAERAASLDSGRREYVLLAGWLHLNLEQADSAVAWLRAAAALDPLSLDVKGQLGLALEKTGDAEGAVEAYRTVAASSPSGFVWRRLGVALVSVQRWGEAAEALERSLELEPDSAESLGYFGVALRHLGQAELAQNYLHLATVTLQQASAEAPTVGAIREGAVASDRTLALPAWAEGLWRDPESSGLEARFSAENALSHLEQGRPEEAIPILRRVTALCPQDASYWNLLGEAYRCQEQYVEARDAFAQAVSQQRQQALFQRNLADAEAHLGHFAEAVAAYRCALGMEERASWRLELADAMAAGGDREGALAEIERAVQMEPGNAWAQQRLGQILISVGRYEDAAAALRCALDLAPLSGNWSLESDLGRALEGEGKLDEAYEQYRKALSLAPDEASLHVAAGAVLRKRLFAERALDRDTGDVASAEDFRKADEHLRQALRLHPELASAHAELGLLLGYAGNQEAALEHHLQAAALAPSEVEYHLYAIDAHLRLGQSREALGLCLNLRERGHADARLLLRLGIAYQELGDWAAALSAYEEAVRLAPYVAEHQYRCGVARLVLGREGAIACLEEALKLDPGHGEWHYSLGQAYAAKRRWQDALREYKLAIDSSTKQASYRRAAAMALGALKRYDEALVAAREAVRLAPNEAESHATLASLLQQHGDLAEALRAYDRASRLQPDRSEYSVRRAIVLGLMGQRERADEELKRILAEEPAFALPYHELALSHERRGQLPEALEAARRAVELEPQSALFLCTLARLLRLAGRTEEALPWLKRALESDPEEAAAYYELGQLLAARGEPGRALGAYQRALELDPKPEFYAGAATVLAREGRLADAAASLQAALAQDPDRAEWHNQLGEVLERQERLPEALEEYRRAIRLEPRQPLYHRNLGVLLKKMARYDEAVESLQRALQIRPDYADAYRHLTSASASALLQKNLRAKPGGSDRRTDT